MARKKTFDEAKTLDKAVHLFWEKGYNATSANDLVKVLGLSRSSLYGTYGDKKTLFVKCLHRYNETYFSELNSAIESAKTSFQALENVFSFVLAKDLDSESPMGCFMVNTAVELARDHEDVKQIVIDHQEYVESALKSVIKKGQKKGEISKEHRPKYLAKYLFNAISGLRVSVKYNRNRQALNQLVTVYLSNLKK